MLIRMYLFSLYGYKLYVASSCTGENIPCSRVQISIIKKAFQVLELRRRTATREKSHHFLDDLKASTIASNPILLMETLYCLINQNLCLCPAGHITSPVRQHPDDKVILNSRVLGISESIRNQTKDVGIHLQFSHCESPKSLLQFSFQSDPLY